MKYSNFKDLPLLNRAYFDADISKIDRQMSYQPLRWCLSPHLRQPPNDFKLAKYEHYKLIIRQRGVIVTPEFNLMNGRADIIDGRHRIYALHDLGYGWVRVCCRATEEAALRRLIG